MIASYALWRLRNRAAPKRIDRLLRSLRAARAEELTHAGQEISRMRHEAVDVFLGELEIGTVIRRLPIQERVVQPTRKRLGQQRRFDVQLIELRDGAAVPGCLGLAGRQQRKHSIEHRVIRAVDRGSLKSVGEVQPRRRERFIRLFQPVTDEHIDLLGAGHAATPSRRMWATSVLADIGPCSKSSAVRITGASSRPCSNPSSHADW